MASPTDISNMALLRCGSRRSIASLTEASQEARICAAFYDQAVAETLAEHPWPFAGRRSTLQLIEENPSSEWGFRYALPVDCAEPLYIEGATRNLPPESLPVWELEMESDVDRVTLVADVPDPVLKYTSSACPSGLYPAYFTSAMSWVLADLIVMPLTMKIEAAQVVAFGRAKGLAHAKARAANQGQKDQPLDSEFVRARV